GGNFAAVMLGGVSVGGLVPTHSDHRGNPENSQVAPGLFGEIVELEGVTTDFTPVSDGDSGHYAKEREREGGKPPRVDPVGSVVEPSQISVGVECRESDFGEVAPFALGSSQGLATLVGVFLHQQDVFFLRSAMPEADFFHGLGEFAG